MDTLFKKILIANRGEIACRIIKSAKRLNIATVAVYSDADSRARHVELADEAVNIGPAAAAQSYLVGEKIIQVAKDRGAEAIHPGYGFLAENADFAAAATKNKLKFIGPSAKAINSMGDKVKAKELAVKAGVNIVPGFVGIVSDVKHAAKIAADIGYPVMIKASAGGGGKGMRIVANAKELPDAFARATGEAQSSFGSSEVFIEKYLASARHIEIQVIADAKGNVVSLGERECSIQRRNQKIIEETPSPFISKETREQMNEQAISLAKTAGYESAGTVEFLVDQNQDFYFLEMNTRLQVEHPVTELVTGYDLVELMLRVAAGEPLPFSQKDVAPSGWAIEARVCAEDPSRNFMPSIGRLTEYLEPAQNNGIRVDSGIAAGDEISLFYDSLIAKVISFGETREKAIEKLTEALDRYDIRGVSNNIGFLSTILSHPRFISGDFNTKFIDEEYPQGFSPESNKEDELAFFAISAAVIHQRNIDRTAYDKPLFSLGQARDTRDWTVITDNQSFNVSLSRGEDGYRASYGGAVYNVSTEWFSPDRLVPGRFSGRFVNIQIDKKQLHFQLDFNSPHYLLSRRGLQQKLLVVRKRTAELRKLMPKKSVANSSKLLLSPMPGLLVHLAVEEGSEVKAGEELAVVEAMKMENSLRADKDVKISKLIASHGQTLDVDQPIMEFE